MSAINTFADRSKNSRLNSVFLSSPAFDSYHEVSLLRYIANAVDPILDPAFSPSLSNAAVRPRMMSILPTIHSLFRTNYDKGEVLLITVASFLQSVQDHNLTASLSNIWHTEKFMNDLGRLLYDYSNVEDGTPINSDFSKDAYKSFFGPLQYPTGFWLYSNVLERAYNVPFFTNSYRQV
jgi:hypothetical protein